MSAKNTAKTTKKTAAKIAKLAKKAIKLKKRLIKSGNKSLKHIGKLATILEKRSAEIEGISEPSTYNERALVEQKYAARVERTQRKIAKHESRRHRLHSKLESVEAEKLASIVASGASADENASK